MNVEINSTKVEVLYWESPDGSQKRYYLKASGSHNLATFNVNTGKFEFPKKSFSAMNIEFARKVMEQVKR